MKLLSIPRTIGALLIAIAIITLYLGGGWISFAILGLIFILAPTKYAERQLDHVIKAVSTKIPIFVALYDALYWLTFTGALYFYKWRLQEKLVNDLGVQAFSKSAMLTPSTAAQLADNLFVVLVYLIGGVLLVLIAAILAYTATRGIMWLTIAKQKPTKKFFVKFLGLNALWWLLFLPAIVFLSAGAQDPNVRIAIIAVLVVSTYFIPIVHVTFLKTHKIWHSIGNGIATGITRIHMFIVPYAYAITIYIIAYQIFKLLPAFYIRPASMIFVVLFLAWLRTYLYEVIKELK